MKINSIKTKTIILLSAFTLFISVIYSALTVLTAYIVEDKIIAKVLAVEAEKINQQYQQTGVLPSASFAGMTVYKTAKDLPNLVKKTLAKTPKAREIFTDDDNHFHLTYLELVSSDNNENLALAKPKQPAILLANVAELLVVSNTSTHVIFLCIALFAFTLMIATWLAYKIALHSTTPILQLTSALQTQQSNKQAIELPKLDYELGYLSQTLQHTFDELQQALSREQEFTKDVSHELRTPLTIIINTLTLSEQRQFTTQDKQQITQASQQMKSTIEVLLALARTHTLAHEFHQNASKFSLRAMLEEVILSCHSIERATNFIFNIHIDNTVMTSSTCASDDIILHSHHTLFQLLLSNVIHNAVKHASSAELNINCSRQCIANNDTETVLVFQNPDQATKPTAEIRQPLQVAQPTLLSQSIGQGLFLIERIARALELDIDVDKSNGLFTLKIKSISKTH